MFKLPVVFCIVMFWIACSNNTTNDNRDVFKNGAMVSIDSAGWPQSFGFGKSASATTIAAMDKDVSADGKGLPHGSGNAVTGSLVYANKCVACHGTNNTSAGGKLPGPPLFANPDSPQIKTIGNYWPYATTIFDYVRRSMPYNAPGSLTDNEVYAVTAYLLHANKLLDTVTSIDATSLPKIIMPAQKRFVADDRKGGPEVK